MKTLFSTLFLLLTVLCYGQNLTINSTVNLPSGNYGSLTLKNHADVHVLNGMDVTVNNINHSDTVMFIVHSGGKFKLNGSLNMNGNFIFENYDERTYIGGAVELQNGNNVFITHKNMSVGDYQINDPTSVMIIKNCGTIFTVRNNANLNSNGVNNFRLVNGAEFHANGLNIGGANIITGYGFIKVLNNLNLNQNLTTSNQITFCYGGNINQPSKLGNAIKSCYYSCTPLPVKLAEAITARYSGSDILVNITFADMDKLQTVKVKQSKDGKVFETVGIIDRSSFVLGKKYVHVIKE